MLRRRSERHGTYSGKGLHTCAIASLRKTANSAIRLVSRASIHATDPEPGVAFHARIADLYQNGYRQNTNRRVDAGDVAARTSEVSHGNAIDLVSSVMGVITDATITYPAHKECENSNLA